MFLNWCLYRGLLLENFILEAWLLYGITKESRLSAAIKANILGIWLSQSKSSSKISSPILVQILPILFVNAIAHRICNIGINSPSIGSYNTAHEICWAHTAFNFKGEYPCLNQLRNIAIHTHILQGQLIIMLIILIQNSTSILLYQLIRPTAWLQASATIAALAEENAGMNALSAFRNTHISMHKILNLQTCPLLEKRQLGESHFSAYHNTGNAVFLQLLDSMLVMSVHHN